VNRWLRNKILMLRGKLVVDSNNGKVKKSILEGDIGIHCGATIKNSVLKGNIEIGSSIDSCVVIGTVIIGKYCAISSDVVFQGLNHSMNYPCMQMKFYKELTGQDLPTESKGNIVIGHNVWIGTRTIVLSGVYIGHGAVVGAGSVVTKDVEPYTIVAGNPARVIRKRFPQKICDELMEKKWWSWSNEQLQENIDFFTKELV